MATSKKQEDRVRGVGRPSEEGGGSDRVREEGPAVSAPALIHFRLGFPGVKRKTEIDLSEFGGSDSEAACGAEVGKNIVGPSFGAAKLVTCPACAWKVLSHKGVPEEARTTLLRVADPFA